MSRFVGNIRQVRDIRRSISALGGMCYPKTNLLQFNKFIIDGVWQDEMGKHDGEAQTGWKYELNGTDNNLEFDISYAGYTLTYKDVAGVEHDEILDGSAIAFDGVAVAIASFVLDSKAWNCEETTGATALSNVDGITAHINGATVHTQDKTLKSVANIVGWGVSAALPNVIIPLNASGNPVVSCETVYKGKAKFDLELLSNCLVNNNTDNAIDIAGKFKYAYQLTDNFGFGYIFNPRVGWLQFLGYSNGTFTIDFANELIYLDRNNVSHSTGVYYHEDRLYTAFERYYQDGANNKIAYYIDNQLVLTLTNVEPSIYIKRFLNLAHSDGSRSVKSLTSVILTDNAVTHDQALNWKGGKIHGGSSELLIPFIQGSGNNIVDINSNTTYTISGASVIWDKQPLFHDIVERGGTWDGTKWIPASNLNIGKDTDGNDLTNPPILDGTKIIGHNGGSLIQQANFGYLPYDTTNHWYDGSGNKKQLTIQEMLPNVNNQIFRNVIDQDKDVRNNLGYAIEQSESDVINIIECNYKGFVLPECSRWALIEGVQVYILSEMEKVYIYQEC